MLLLLNDENDVARDGVRLQSRKAHVRNGAAGKQVRRHERTASSASPRNTIFWLCCMPRSTFTSRIFLSCTVLLPRHCGQRSFSLMTWPAPRNGATQRVSRVRRGARSRAPRASGQNAEGLACASAVLAHRLHLLHHARRNLAQVDFNPSPLAARAAPRVAGLAALPVAAAARRPQRLRRRVGGAARRTRRIWSR